MWASCCNRSWDPIRRGSVGLIVGMIAFAMSAMVSHSQESKSARELRNQWQQNQQEEAPKLEYAVFGGGCFWCIEAVFERVWGVHAVVSGYAGGNVPNPTYEMVSTDRTGHAEVCKIAYDPEVVSYEELLRIFFKSHDPTILNGQGPDFGTRYRSVILYNDEEEKEVIEALLEEFKKKRSFKRKIVTEIAPLKAFFVAEEYHQDYFAKHPGKPYCEMNIRPKIGKFERAFKENSKLQRSRQENKGRDN